MTPILDAKRLPKAMMGDAEHVIMVNAVVAAARLGGTFVEIGTRRGRGLFSLYSIFKAMGATPPRVVSIDPKPVEGKLKATLDKIGGGAKLHEMYRVLSYTFDVERVRGASFVFVDGCHCFRCCRDDIERFGPVIQPGGYLVAHDIHTGKPGTITYRSRQYCYRTGGPTESGVWPAVHNCEALDRLFTLDVMGGDVDGIGVWRRNA